MKALFETSNVQSFIGSQAPKQCVPRCVQRTMFIEIYILGLARSTLLYFVVVEYIMIFCDGGNKVFSFRAKRKLQIKVILVSDIISACVTPE